MANILVTDDSSFMRSMLRKILEKMGHTVVEAENGDDALAKYRKKRPDLVILDVIMPGMDGLACLKALRAEDPTVNAIMCSSMGQQLIVVDAIKSGAKDFIVKPFNAALVMDSVRRALM